MTGLPSSYLQRLGSNFPAGGARHPQVPPKEGRGRQKEEKPPTGRI